MKRLVFVITAIVMCVIMQGCTRISNMNIRDQISEERINCYVGQVDATHATLMCGMREKDYIINGYSGSLIQFGVITATINTDVESDISYVLKTNDNNEYRGIMERNPYDGSYVADIGVIIQENSVNLTLKWGSITKNLTLDNISRSWQVDSSTALDIAIKECSKELNKMCANNSFNGEVYIKIRSGGEKNTYMWYIYFVGINGDKISVFVSTDTGTVLYKKCG